MPCASAPRPQRSIDGATGIEAAWVLAPLGCWPPKLDPTEVREVRVEWPQDHRTVFRLHFTTDAEAEADA